MKLEQRVKKLDGILVSTMIPSVMTVWLMEELQKPARVFMMQIQMSVAIMMVGPLLFMLKIYVVFVKITLINIFV
jgi:hypothetical protein